MPDSLETVHQTARRRLDAEVAYREALRKARATGHSFQQIAEAAGVTRSAVYQILNPKERTK